MINCYLFVVDVFIVIVVVTVVVVVVVAAAAAVVMHDDEAGVVCKYTVLESILLYN